MSAEILFFALVRSFYAHWMAKESGEDLGLRGQLTYSPSPSKLQAAPLPLNNYSADLTAPNRCGQALSKLIVIVFEPRMLCFTFHANVLRYQAKSVSLLKGFLSSFC